MVGVHFDVVVLDALFLEEDPNTLDERAEPAGVEFQGLGGGMGLKRRKLLDMR